MQVAPQVDLARHTWQAKVTLALGAGPASADGGRAHRDAENTFTKYISSFPDMAGVVGGAVGDGAYAGEITTLTVTATALVIDADYHFYGSIHTFSARVHIVQTGFADGSTAVITGRVTEGWLRDNLAGQYQPYGRPTRP